jgi:hypothetical protein
VIEQRTRTSGCLTFTLEKSGWWDESREVAQQGSPRFVVPRKHALDGSLQVPEIHQRSRVRPVIALHCVAEVKPHRRMIRRR